MSKLSTKIRQKQSIIPKQILQSSYLELSLDDIEKELENEIQKNPVLIEKNIEDSKARDYDGYGFDRQESYDLFLSNLPEDRIKMLLINLLIKLINLKLTQYQKKLLKKLS